MVPDNTLYSRNSHRLPLPSQSASTIWSTSEPSCVHCHLDSCCSYTCFMSVWPLLHLAQTHTHSSRKCSVHHVQSIRMGCWFSSGGVCQSQWIWWSDRLFPLNEVLASSQSPNLQCLSRSSNDHHCRVWF